MASAPRKKLIEVSLPLDAINEEALRRKQKAPKGFPTAIHKYWAQRPIAICRAVLFAQLVDDPSGCEDEFQTVEAQRAERERLHELIKTLVLWENSSNEHVLSAARYEIARSIARSRRESLPALAAMEPQEIINYLQINAPPVYDPFSGGGSIPLEAQRLGLRAMGSDLNPVAVLIGKALVEFPPKFARRRPVNPLANQLRHWNGAEGLADDVRYYGRWMKDEAEKRIGHLYPKAKLKDGRETTTVAWLWARTVPSPDPRAEGAPVPLASSFVLSSKVGKEVIVRPIVDRENRRWQFEIDEAPGAEAFKVARAGTKAARGANFVCLLTGAAIDDSHVKREAKAGRMGAALMAIVADGGRGRIYLAPTQEQAEAASVAAPEVAEIDQPLPHDPRAFWTVLYGLDSFAKLFTSRQLIALTTFSDLVREARDLAVADARQRWMGQGANDERPLAEGGRGIPAYADAVATYLAFVVDRIAFYGSSICRWLPKDNAMAQAMARQGIAMSYDYAEGSPFGSSSSDISTCTRAVADCVEIAYVRSEAQIELKDAQENQFQQGAIFSTDPPYYDNIGYADLSDFFYVWLRRSLREIHPNLFRRILTPKVEELVAIPYRQGGKENAELHFLNGMKKALSHISASASDTPTTIYYAYKQTEVGEDMLTSPGWSSFLQAAVDAGLAVDGTWPVRSESEGRSLAQGTNALASSIVLVCRHRSASAETVTRADYLRALRREMPTALDDIGRAGVGPTDIQQAAIGPGIGIFTRYAQVLNTDGSPMLVRDALKLINQVREEITSHDDADYDSETRFALDWFAAKGFDTGDASDAITMTNAVNLSLGAMVAAGFFEASGGKARLKKRTELPAAWNPQAAKRVTVWEACQHLIKLLDAEQGGLEAAAALYAKLGPLAEPAWALARRLYDLCEQRQWATEARFYNRLYQEWDAIERRAADLGKRAGPPDLLSRL